MPAAPRSKPQKYIVHLDGDAFFVSVETAKNPALRGKPVVTGKERGIASALSYEAKALGITRAMPVFQIRREFPQVAVVESDYESYAVFSKRMMDIVRRYTPVVEEYSIDECFADFSLVAGFAEDFPRKALAVLGLLKSDIKKELGISVSLGLGPTKVLAKTASKSKKPDGLVVLSPEDREGVLGKTPVDKVWGIGSATAFALRKRGVATALDLARKPLAWVEEHFSKPMAEMWYELNGISVRPVGGSTGEEQKSVMTTRTFSPATNDRSYLFSELSKNIESATKRARELGLVARDFSIFLKSRDFSYASEHCRLSSPSDNPFDIVPEARALFEKIFDPERLYRATGVTLSGLMPALMRQDDFFGSSVAMRGESEVFRAVDRVNKRYGRSVIRLASSEKAFVREERADAAEEALRHPFAPRGSNRRLSVPYLGEVS